MAGLRLFAFSPWSVASLLVATYVALLAALLCVHHLPPAAPTQLDRSWHNAVNVTEAWLDLQLLSSSYHPFNSHANDRARDWLLRRVHQILDRNNASWHSPSPSSDPPHAPRAISSDPAVLVFDDRVSNVTFASDPSSPLSVYFEGSNILVYIPGSEDDPSRWWDPRSADFAPRPRNEKRGVLVNAHFDSVSTGLGATDDGVGVVSILQLIAYYSAPGRRPKRGLLALLNNGEEDYLNGARAFALHPLAAFPDTFLNLEGAGAGGRAALFRSTDAQVTVAYRASPYPFGTAVSADGFKRGLVRSQTDYVVFNEQLGMRGLDVAFIEPRSKYHTLLDSTPNTSKDSVWHMLSAALATTQVLTSDVRNVYGAGEQNDAVYFDLFGRALAVLPLLSMLAISITLLVVGPLLAALLLYSLARSDRIYLFARAIKSDPTDPHAPDDETIVSFDGWRGVFRFPIALVFGVAGTLALALLVTRVNPHVAYSSPYALWTMMLTAFSSIVWFVLRGADYMRPTALQRSHALGWIFLITWVLLLASTIAADSQQLASGYPAVFLNSTTLVALLLSYFELFFLPRKADYALLAAHGPDHAGLEDAASERPWSRSTEATETTSLLGRPTSRRSRPGSAGASRPAADIRNLPRPYGEEQEWSGSLPSWLWIPQFLLIGPINIILLSQIGLFLTSALAQTSADGNPVMLVHATMALLSVLILLPLTPFIHRVPSRIPSLLALVAVGCLLYNLLAFPFSDHNRLKVFFKQKVDLVSGDNNASITAIPSFIHGVVAELPSAAGQTISCTDPELASRKGLETCSWPGLQPHVAGSASLSSLSKPDYSSWLTLTSARLHGKPQRARFSVRGLNSRACRLYFDSPITDYNITGASKQDARFPKIADAGADELRLWSREWNNTWDVEVAWRDDTARLSGRAACLWSDQNSPDLIPALEEVKTFAPAWTVVTKLDDGLVEGFKAFDL